MIYTFSSWANSEAPKIGERRKNLPQLTLFMMGLFVAGHGWEGKKTLLPPICHTYPKMMKLGTIKAYLEKIQKI